MLLLLLSTPGWADDAFGTWKMDPARSKSSGDSCLIVRFTAHARGEVFTLDRTAADGRITTSSTVLYLGGKSRDFEDQGCSGTQLPRRVDSRTVEILRQCENGKWIRLVRRSPAQPKELILEITERHPDGSRIEQRLVLEKQQ